MRLDQIDVFTVAVDDLRFAVRMTWAEWRKLVDVSTDVAVPTADDAPEVLADKQSKADAALDEWRDTLRKHVIGIEGLTDVDAEGVEHAVPWQADLVDKLGPLIVRTVFLGICQPGAARQVGDPLA